MPKQNEAEFDRIYGMLSRVQTKLKQYEPVIEAAKACVRGLDQDYSDGSTDRMPPFSERSMAMLGDTVRALLAIEKGE